MTIETATYISDLNSANPTASDLKSEGDDHIRLVKSVVKATFPSFSGAVTTTHTALNYLTAAAIADVSGNVGIGGAPSTILDIKAAAAATWITSTTGTNGAQFRIANTGGYLYTALDNSAGTSFGSPYMGVMWHTGAYPLAFATNSTERMRIDSNGNVGIGTSTMTEKFNVSQGNFYLLRTGGAKLRLADQFNEVSFESVPVAASSDAVFKTSTLERMRIDASGNMIPVLQTSPPALAVNSQMVFNLTSNTNLRISVRGTDGTTRVANITLS